MAPKITDEMREILARNPDQPVQVEDDETHRTYFLIESEQVRRLFDDHLRRELQIGFEQADRGESQPWDIQQTHAEAHRRHSKQEL